MFHFEINPNDPACIQRALNTEWLLTNGLGGYAMGTILGVNTRRYHGLLVAATKPPVGRIVALHSMIEQLVIPKDDGPEEVIDLSTQQFVGPDGEPMLHPGGWKHLQTFFGSNRSCVWVFNVDDLVVRRWLAPNPNGLENDLTIRYEFEGNWPTGAILRLRPLVSMRDFHSLNASSPPGSVGRRSNCAVFECNGYRLNWCASLAFKESFQDWRRFAYTKELEKGLDWVEDLWSPGQHDCPVATESFVHISVTVPHSGPNVSEPVVLQSAKSEAPLYRLACASDRFVVARGAAKSIIAGYPWFGDWGRDTMISLPGLMLCTKRYDEALSCLLMFAKNIRNGLIPNVFDDYGGPAHYNTVDASLWFIHAVHEYWAVKDRANVPFENDLIDACRAIIAAYRNGTDFDIRMDPVDGLIAAGDEGSQLTWMDAKRDGVVFTPRHGKPVEVNALWHNALSCMAEMTDDAKEREELLVLSRQAAQSFQTQFWWNERDCLHDVLLRVRDEDANGGVRFSPNGQLRPNQIFAVRLPFSPLNESQQRAVVKIVGERLLTPFGLRTLDRDDPNYRGRYEGSLFERDRAYHNGTAWPWLMGPYCEALLRVEKFSNAAKQKVREILQPLLNELDVPNGGCVNQLAEVYDGDAPQRPNGCPAQAWSVAEVLRILTMVGE